MISGILGGNSKRFLTMWKRIRTGFLGLRSEYEWSGPRASLIGELLLYNLVGGKNYDVPPEPLVADIPAEYRGLVTWWVRIYLAWVLLAIAAERGQSRADIMDAVAARLEKVTDPEAADEFRELAKVLRYWFSKLDRTATWKNTWLAGLAFLALDPESPFYGHPNPDIPDALEMGLMQALQAARDQGDALMRKLVNEAIRRGTD